MSTQAPVLFLQADQSGMPIRWIDYTLALTLYAKELVIMELGDECFLFRGGVNRRTGQRTEVAVGSILLVRGQLAGRRFLRGYAPPFSRRLLYRRDRMCLYCGNDALPERQYTVDHVVPQSRGGRTTYANTVLSCRSCNHSKGNRTPEEWSLAGGRKLLAVPYAPDLNEALILSNRRVLADQQTFLMSHLRRGSPLLERLS